MQALAPGKISARLALAVIVMAPLGVGACASMDTETGGEVVSGAVQRPFRDLNLIRDEAPPVLVRAAEAPYAHRDLGVCNAVQGEIAELDRLLGPDIDTEVTEEDSDAVAIASDAIRGLFDLPFRGVVRRITGAHDRDAAIRRAVLAGMVRRGYLKGMAEERGCNDPVQQAGAIAAMPPQP